MPDINIRRDHQLGSAKARELAATWAEQAQKKFGMTCSASESEDGQTYEFKRSGVSGTLLVADDHLEINAKLGFMLAALGNTVEAEIQKHLDELLAQAGARPA